jgi:hypothetical protein
MRTTHILSDSTVSEYEAVRNPEAFHPGDYILLAFPQGTHSRVFPLYTSLVLGRTNVAEEGIINLNLYRAYEFGVSRQHAMLSLVDDRIEIADLQSSNGTCVNGVALRNGQSVVIRDGDRINLGRLEVRIHMVGHQPDCRAALG